MPSIDVAIPNYNYGRYLRQCVESVLNQEGVDLRVLIIDNASTDNSVEIAQDLAANDRRIEIVARQKNLGPHASWNESIDWASAEYFMVVCSDDLLPPGSLFRATSVMVANPDVCLAYGRDAPHFGEGPVAFDTQGDGGSGWQIVSGSDFVSQLCRTPEAPPTAVTSVVRLSAQKAVGYYRPHLIFTDDLEMMLRLATQGSVARTDAVQLILRHHEQNISKPLWDNHLKYFVEHKATYDSFFCNEGRNLNEAKRFHRVVKYALARQAYWSGVSHFLRGHPSESYELFRFAFSNAPQTTILPPLGHLLRKKHNLQRILQIIRTAFAR